MNHTPGPPPEPAESNEFQLPVLGLFADFEMGRGSVRLTDEFQRCSNAVQLEILSDWQAALAQCTREALDRLHAELRAVNPHLGAAEQLALLRATCQALGIGMPAGWPAAPPPALPAAPSSPRSPRSV
jgi:hypothetical protein